jgi:hypothetical protein
MSADQMAIPRSGEEVGDDYDEEEVPAGQPSPEQEVPESDLESVALLEEQAKEFEQGMIPGAKAAMAAVAEGARGERVPLPGQEDRFAALQSAIDSHDLDLRSALGQKFTAFVKANPTKQEEYKGMKEKGKSYQMKKEFRMRWVQQELEGVSTVTESKLEEYQKIDAEMGTYQPLEMIVQSEGGRTWKTAWQAAINYATKCRLLGGEWLTFNGFTNRVEYLYVKKQKQSLFLQKWSLYSETMAQKQAECESSSPSSAAAGPETPVKTGPPRVDAAAAPTPARVKVELGAQDSGVKRKKGATGGGDLPSGKRQAPVDKDNQKILRAALATKTLYNKVTTMHASRIHSLEHDPEWSDLATPSTISRLKSLFTEMNTAASEVFARTFLINEVADVKKNCTKDNMNEF